MVRVARDPPGVPGAADLPDLVRGLYPAFAAPSARRGLSRLGRVPALFRAAEQLPQVVLRPEIVTDGVLRFLLHRPFRSERVNVRALILPTLVLLAETRTVKVGLPILIRDRFPAPPRQVLGRRAAEDGRAPLGLDLLTGIQPARRSSSSTTWIAFMWIVYVEPLPCSSRRSADRLRIRAPNTHLAPAAAAAGPEDGRLPGAGALRPSRSSSHSRTLLRASWS
jgi:hypothetical protein